MLVAEATNVVKNQYIMKLSEFKSHLSQLENLHFELPTGKKVPAHFHVTEVGQITKNFIDCGGTVRKESVVNFQLWKSIDFHHRLNAEKLMNIIEISENKLGIQDDEIEVEYQGDTIGKYGVAFEDGTFKLTATQTDCLAKDNCGIPVEKIKTSLKNLTSSVQGSDCCTPGGGCC